jgi:hypothetical protein
MSQDYCAPKKKDKIITLINKETDLGDKQSRKARP